MLDHAYNLLRLRGPGYDPGGFPAPPVPAGFAPPAPSSALRAVRSVLFGSDPDAGYVERRMRQYMTILSAGRHRDHLVATDPRISYEALLRVAVPPPGPPEVATAPGAPELSVVGTVAADDARGVSTFAWAVAAVPTAAPFGGDGLLWSPVLPPPFFFASDPGDGDDAGGLFWPLVLPIPFGLAADRPLDGPAALTARRVAPAPRDDPTIGDAAGGVALSGSALVATPRSAPAGPAGWGVTATVEPGRGLAAVLADLDALGAETLRALFGDAADEPAATHRNLFRDHDQTPERLTGALLALIARTDEAVFSR